MNREKSLEYSKDTPSRNELAVAHLLPLIPTAEHAKEQEEENLYENPFEDHLPQHAVFGGH